MEITLPKISIIVPVYNVESYASKCIESIIKQTYENLEILIVNDGSTDTSGDICEYYAQKDNRIIIIHQKNQGLSMARNNALEIAGGDYIGFVDSDDWIATDMYSVLYKNAVEYDADISVCNYYYVSASGELSPHSNEHRGIKVFEGIYKLMHNIRLFNSCVWNKLYKRHLFDDIRFPKGKTYEDIFITHKLIDNANKVVMSSECKYYYLQRESGITLSTFNPNQMDNLEAYIERHKYISAKYPALEKTYRKHIFLSLLWGMRRAYISNRIEKYKEILIKYIEIVKCYDFSGCGLSAEEANLIKLLFADIESYITEMNVISTNVKGSKEN